MTGTPARTFGNVLHRVLADLIDADGTSWQAEHRLRWLAHHPLVRARIAGPEVATRNKLSVALGVYRHHFVLGDRWHLVGVDVRTARSELDFVWCRDDGVTVADEMKSGAIKPATLRGLEEQLARQLSDGPKVYGEPFIGVRALLLQAPGDSRFFGVDGSIQAVDVVNAVGSPT